MTIKLLMTPKDKIQTIPVSLNSFDALSILEDQNLRNAPVVDDTGDMYRGNIYRYHLYQHGFNYPDKPLQNIPVTYFLKNSTRVIHSDDSLYRLIFAIKDLPYITVLNDDNRFIGVVYHQTILNYFADAWGAAKPFYYLEIQLDADPHALQRLLRLINRYTPVESIISQQPTRYHTSNSVIITISKNLDIMQFNALLRLLKRRKYRYKAIT